MKTIDLSRRGGVVTDTQPEIFPLPTGLLPKDDLTNRKTAHLEKGFTSPNCPPELRDKYYHDGADSWRNRPDSDE